MSFSPDGAQLASASGTAARILDAQTGEQIAVLRERTKSDTSFSTVGATLSPSGDRVLWHSETGAQIWDLRTSEHIANLEGYTISLAAPSFSPDGDHIVTASKESTVQIWNARTIDQIAVLKGNEVLVRSAVFTTGGRRVITESLAQTIHMERHGRRATGHPETYTFPAIQLSWRPLNDDFR